MGVRNFIVKTVKDNTNVKGWASWGSVKANAKNITDFMGTFKKDSAAPSAQKETFSEVMKKYGLTERDVAIRSTRHFNVAMFCAFFGIAAFAWMFILFFKGMVLSGIVALAVSVLMFSYAFREHFFYYEMKHRRLDCTVKEWFSSLFGRTGKNI